MSALGCELLILFLLPSSGAACSGAEVRTVLTLHFGWKPKWGQWRWIPCPSFQSFRGWRDGNEWPCKTAATALGCSLSAVGCPRASSPAVILVVLVSTLEFSCCSHDALQPYGFMMLLWSCRLPQILLFLPYFQWYEELSQPVPWALALFIPKFVMIPGGTKNWEVTKVGRSSAGSSARVRAGGGREAKEQQARDFLDYLKDILET